MGNFVIIKTANGEYSFRLKEDNSQIILTSQLYSSKSDCIDGIELVRTNCSEFNRYERKKSINKKHYFVLKTSDEQIIGNSEMYDTNAGMDNGIESVKKNGESTTVVEEEPYF